MDGRTDVEPRAGTVTIERYEIGLTKRSLLDDEGAVGSTDEGGTVPDSFGS